MKLHHHWSWVKCKQRMLAMQEELLQTLMSRWQHIELQQVSNTLFCFKIYPQTLMSALDSFYRHPKDTLCILELGNAERHWWQSVKLLCRRGHLGYHWKLSSWSAQFASRTAILCKACRYVGSVSRFSRLLAINFDERAREWDLLCTVDIMRSSAGPEERYLADLRQ